MCRLALAKVGLVPKVFPEDQSTTGLNSLRIMHGIYFKDILCNICTYNISPHFFVCFLLSKVEAAFSRGQITCCDRIRQAVEELLSTLNVTNLAWRGIKTFSKKCSSLNCSNMNWFLIFNEFREKKKHSFNATAAAKSGGQVTCDIRKVTCYTWNVTYDTWHMTKWCCFSSDCVSCVKTMYYSQ